MLRIESPSSSIAFKHLEVPGLQTHLCPDSYRVEPVLQAAVILPEPVQGPDHLIATQGCAEKAQKKKGC